MPVSHIGFKLKPSGFFDGNPALDMPESAASHCHHHGHHDHGPTGMGAGPATGGHTHA
jgi:primary-amine oxidase